MMKKTSKFLKWQLLSGLLLAAGQIGAWAKPGDLDMAFGYQGKAVTSLVPQRGRAETVAVQEDGKIIVAGQRQTASGEQDWLIVRYHSNGIIDTSFGQQGMVITDFGSNQETAMVVKILADGKILVSGSSILDASTGAYGRYVVARYNSDGSLDSGFGQAGKVSIPFRDTDYANASGLLALPNGQYLLTGMIHYNQPANATADPDADLMLVKLNQDGSIDLSFGQDGMAFALFGLALEIATDAVLQPDGKILVSGYQDQGNKIDGFVARFNSNGSADASFGQAGITTTDFDDSTVYAQALALQADNKILVVGTVGDTQSSRCFAGRLNGDGSMDSSFGSNGYVLLADGRRETCRDVIAENGNILLTGKSETDRKSMTIMRLNANGGMDREFSDNGRQMVDFGQNTVSSGAAMALVDNASVVIAGILSNVDTEQELAFAKVKLTDANDTAIECLFDWAERNYQAYIAPSGSPTQQAFPYIYRYYRVTDSYLGVSSLGIAANSMHLYYLAPGGRLFDLGDVSDWLERASCR